MNNIKIFNDKLFGNVRGYLDGDMPWLCLADVCAALGIVNNRHTVSRLNQPGVVKSDIGVETGKKVNGKPAVQVVKATFINEPNLYRLILRSNKPAAEKFIDWVTGDILPTLRRTGSYTDPKSKIPTMESITGSRQMEYGDKLTNAIAKDVWAAVDKVYLKWLTKARAAEALHEFKRQVGRI